MGYFQTAKTLKVCGMILMNKARVLSMAAMMAVLYVSCFRARRQEL